MQEQKVPSLPPGQQYHSPKGHLTITTIALTFFQQSHQQPLIKVIFWGTHPVLAPIHSPLVFPVISGPLKFKLYLVESRTTQIEVVDSRNGKSIGCAFLNWELYLRSMDDQQLYS